MSKKGNPLQTYGYSLKAADGGAADGRVQAVLSTESTDRMGDIIRQDGWALDNFLKHPILLTGHDYHDITAQIGRWEGVHVDSKRLVGVAHYYAGEGNPKADWAYHVARKGEAAYSVGFQPLEYGPREDVDGADEWWGPFEFRSQELLETSHVNVPANAEALNLALRSVVLPAPVAAVMEAVLASARGVPPLAELLGIEPRVMAEALAGRLLRRWNTVKPFENEHTCRLRDPDDFEDDSFRRADREHEGKKYSVIMGRLEGEDVMTEQSYRYPKDVWDVDEARAHCKEHDGQLFEPASDEEEAIDVAELATVMRGLIKRS